MSCGLKGDGLVTVHVQKKNTRLNVTGLDISEGAEETEENRVLLK